MKTDDSIAIKNDVAPFISVYIIIIFTGFLFIFLALLFSSSLYDGTLALIFAFFIFFIVLPINYRSQSFIPYELIISETGIQTRSR